MLKVREGLSSYEDPGWYEHPPGTVASLASADELDRDGITIPAAKQTKVGAPQKSTLPAVGTGRSHQHH